MYASCRDVSLLLSSISAVLFLTHCTYYYILFVSHFTSYLVDRSMSLRNFPSLSRRGIGKSATFAAHHELGVMTLDRRGHMVPANGESTTTLESR